MTRRQRSPEGVNQVRAQVQFHFYLFLFFFLHVHLLEQLPAQVPSQHAVQRLLVPAHGDPAEMLLEAELCSLEAGLRQRADQEAVVQKKMRT